MACAKSVTDRTLKMKKEQLNVLVSGASLAFSLCTQEMVIGRIS